MTFSSAVWNRQNFTFFWNDMAIIRIECMNVFIIYIIKNNEWNLECSNIKHLIMFVNDLWKFKLKLFFILIFRCLQIKSNKWRKLFRIYIQTQSHVFSCISQWYFIETNQKNQSQIFHISKYFIVFDMINTWLCQIKLYENSCLIFLNCQIHYIDQYIY